MKLNETSYKQGKQDSNPSDLLQRTLTIGGRITVQLVSGFTSMDLTASLHTNNNVFSFLVKSSLFKPCHCDTFTYVMTITFTLDLVQLIFLIWALLFLFNYSLYSQWKTQWHNIIPFGTFELLNFCPNGKI